MKILKSTRNRMFLRLITFMVITTFLCQNTLLADSSVCYRNAKDKLAAVSRWDPYFKRHNLGAENLLPFVAAVKSIKKVIDDNKGKPDLDTRVIGLINRLNQQDLKNLPVKIVVPEFVRMPRIKLKKKDHAVIRVPYLLFSFYGECHEVYFGIDTGVIDNDSLKEIGIKDPKDYNNLSVPGVEGAWVNPKPQRAIRDRQYIVGNIDLQRKMYAFFDGRPFYKIGLIKGFFKSVVLRDIGEKLVADPSTDARKTIDAWSDYFLFELENNYSDTTQITHRAKSFIKDLRQSFVFRRPDSSSNILLVVENDMLGKVEISILNVKGTVKLRIRREKALSVKTEKSKSQARLGGDIHIKDNSHRIHESAHILTNAYELEEGHEQFDNLIVKPLLSKLALTGEERKKLIRDLFSGPKSPKWVRDRRFAKEIISLLFEYKYWTGSAGSRRKVLLSNLYEKTGEKLFMEISDILFSPFPELEKDIENVLESKLDTAGAEEDIPMGMDLIQVGTPPGGDDKNYRPRKEREERPGFNVDLAKYTELLELYEEESRQGLIDHLRDISGELGISLDILPNIKIEKLKIDRLFINVITAVEHLKKVRLPIEVKDGRKSTFGLENLKIKVTENEISIILGREELLVLDRRDPHPQSILRILFHLLQVITDNQLQERIDEPGRYKERDRVTGFHKDYYYDLLKDRGIFADPSPERISFIKAFFRIKFSLDYISAVHEEEKIASGKDPVLEEILSEYKYCVPLTIIDIMANAGDYQDILAHAESFSIDDIKRKIFTKLKYNLQLADGIDKEFSFSGRDQKLYRMIPGYGKRDTDYFLVEDSGGRVIAKVVTYENDSNAQIIRLFGGTPSSKDDMEYFRFLYDYGKTIDGKDIQYAQSVLDSVLSEYTKILKARKKELGLTSRHRLYAELHDDKDAILLIRLLCNSIGFFENDQVVVDENGMLFHVKQKTKNEDESHGSYEEKNEYMREILAQRIGRGLVNTVQIRTIAPQETDRLSRYTYTSQGNWYLSKITLSYKKDDLVQKTPGKAESAQLVFQTLIRKWDPLASNREFVEGVPVIFDNDCVFDKDFQSLGKFIEAYVMHAGRQEDPGAAFKITGYSRFQIERSIIEFQEINDFRRLAHGAGFRGKELDRIVKFLKENQKNLRNDVYTLLEKLTEEDFTVEKEYPASAREQFMRLLEYAEDAEDYNYLIKYIGKIKGEKTVPVRQRRFPVKRLGIGKVRELEEFLERRVKGVIRKGGTDYRLIEISEKELEEAMERDISSIMSAIRSINRKCEREGWNQFKVVLKDAPVEEVDDGISEKIGIATRDLEQLGYYAEVLGHVNSLLEDPLHEIETHGAIGDIHGNAVRLRQLSAYLIEQKGMDKIVLMGDYFDRDKTNKPVYETLKLLDSLNKAIFLLGNHDLFLLLTMRGDRDAFKEWLTWGGIPFFEELGMRKEMRDLEDLKVGLFRKGVPEEDLIDRLDEKDMCPEFIDELFKKVRSNHVLKEINEWLSSRGRLFYRDNFGTLYSHAGIPLLKRKIEGEEGKEEIVINLEHKGLKGMDALKLLDKEFRQWLTSESPIEENTDLKKAVKHLLNIRFDEWIVPIMGLHEDEIKEITEELGILRIVFAHTNDADIINIKDLIFGIDLRAAESYGGLGGAFKIGPRGISLAMFESRDDNNPEDLKVRTVMDRDALLGDMRTKLILRIRNLKASIKALLESDTAVPAPATQSDQIEAERRTAELLRSV